MTVKICDLVRYGSAIYEVSDVKTDTRGYWIQLSSEPDGVGVKAVTGIMREAWIAEEALERAEVEE